MALPPLARRYQLKLDPARHALLASRFLRVAATAATAADLTSYFPAARDQGSEGICSGMSSADVTAALWCILNGKPLPYYLAAAYIYWRARLLEGTFPQDAGASMADEFATLQTYGICPEPMLPFRCDPAEAGTASCDEAAKAYRLTSQPVDPQDTANLKALLAARKPIAFGFSVYSSFETPAADGTVSQPNTKVEQLLGGHGVGLVGFDDRRGVWKVRNQWGTSWGAAGYCYMPYGYEKLWSEAYTGSVPAADVAPAPQTWLQRLLRWL